MKYLVAFSGGKDSVAMVLHLLELGINRSDIHLHHHEVDGGGQNLWDWGGTASYCQAFADAMGLKLFFSGRFGGIDREMLRTNEGCQSVYYYGDGEKTVLTSKPGSTTRLKFPAVAADLRTRWCSACIKINVFSRVITNLYPTGEYIVCTGERGEESANRARYAKREPHQSNSLKRSVTAWRPILDWTEGEVWAIIERWKIQPHPCYELGYSRCSCQICIFGSANVWASNAELSPSKLVYIRQREIEFGFTLYNGMTILEKAKKGVSFLLPENVKKWKNQALIRFTLPIIVEKWKLPQGAFVQEKAGSL